MKTKDSLYRLRARRWTEGKQETEEVESWEEGFFSKNAWHSPSGSIVEEGNVYDLIDAKP